jgi:hypothetical protein
MGGKGSGGARVGSGPKRKSDREARLTGARKRMLVQGVPLPPAPPIAQPEGLPADQQAVWAELYPLAVEARTLTAATLGSFRDLVRSIVVRDRILEDINATGWTYLKHSVDGAGVEHEELRKHPLVSDLRGWEQRVEAGRARFRLAPIGKEIASRPREEDAFSEFEHQ